MTLDKNLIRFEVFEDDAYGIVAISADVQIGQCRKIDGQWLLSDMDGKVIGDPFEDLRAAEIGRQRHLPIVQAHPIQAIDFKI